MSQRITPYLHNYSSSEAKRDSLCTVTLRPLVNRTLSLTENLRLLTAMPNEGLKPFSFSHQILHTVLPGHGGYIRFVPSIHNVYGYSHGRWTDVYVPRFSAGLYEVLNMRLDP